MGPILIPDGHVTVLGVGIDLVDIPRVEKMLVRFGDRALGKLLTDAERRYVSVMAHPARHVAARIAAKEAGYKALQSLPDARAVGWRDLEVRRDGEGRPTLVLLGYAGELAIRHGPLQMQLSLTHADVTAGAIAVLLQG